MVPADAKTRSNERYWFLSAQQTVSGRPFADRRTNVLGRTQTALVRGVHGTHSPSSSSRDELFAASRISGRITRFGMDPAHMRRREGFKP